MSLNDLKKEESKCEDNLERNLQYIVNDLTNAMDYLKMDSKLFEKFEEVFKNSNSLEEIVSAISLMFKKFVKNLKLLNFSQQTKASTIVNDSVEKNVSESNYQNLEKVLQKYEAEIREHIRIEQQLKIYSESLEAKIDKLKKGKIVKKESLTNLNELNKALKKKNEKLLYEKKQLENQLNSLIQRKGSYVDQQKNNSIEKKTDIQNKITKLQSNVFLERTKYSVKKAKKDSSLKTTLRNNDFILNFKSSYKKSMKKSSNKNKLKNRVSSYSQKILT